MELKDEHNWTINNMQFVCIDCGYLANEEESKILSSYYWYSQSVDLNVSEKVIYLNPEKKEWLNKQ